MAGAPAAAATIAAVTTSAAEKIKQKQQRAVLQSSTHQQLQAALLTGPPNVIFKLSSGMKELQNQIRDGLPITVLAQKIVDADDQWPELLLLSIAVSDVEVIKKLLEARIKINVSHTLNGIRFTCFQLAGAVYDNRPSPEAFSAFEEIAAHSNTAQTLESFRVFLRYTDVQPQDLQRIGTRIVLGSLYPITTSIQVADVMRRAGAKIISRRDQLEKIGVFFTNLALQLLNSLGSDHIASIALEIRNDQGISAIEAALATSNMDFMTDLMVIRVISNIWTSPNYLAQTVMVEPGQRGNRLPLHRLLVMNPMKFFRLNKAKFIIRTVGLVAFLIFLSAAMLARPHINDPVSFLELLTWISGAGFVICEISEMHRLGLHKYSSSGWNQIDVVAWSSLIVAAVWRISCSLLLSGSVSFQQSVYDGLMSFIVVILWVRLTRAFAINSSLGTLTRMLNQFARDIFVFSLLLSVIIVGFGIALCAVVGDQLEGYKTVGGSLFTLYQSALGQFDFAPFQILDTGKRIVAQSLLGVFLLVSIVVLVNLLVAMMADTYTKVQDRSQKEFLCGWSELTWEIHQETNTLPPPFNLIVYVLGLPYMLIRRCRDFAPKAPLHSSPQLTPVRGRALPAIIEQRLSMSLMSGSVVLTETFAPEWVCGNCWTVNNVRSNSENYSVTENWISKIEGSVPVSLKFVPDRSVSLCVQCKSLKRTISRRQRRLEKISFAIFMVLIWFPASTFLVGPQIIEYCLKSCFNSIKQLALMANAFGKDEANKNGTADHTHNGKARSASTNERAKAWVQAAIQSTQVNSPNQ